MQVRHRWIGCTSDAQRPPDRSGIREDEGLRYWEYKNSAKWEATYFGVVGSRSIKNIRANLPFPSASSRTRKAKYGMSTSSMIR